MVWNNIRYSMKVNVANPIHDSVFKFLMKRTHRKDNTFDITKKEVMSVKMRPYEYVNTTRDALSMFHIDFAANVREENGKEHLILLR